VNIICRNKIYKADANVMPDTYEDYRPAYQLGWESRSKHASRSFDEAEPELGRAWEEAKRQSQLTWEKAKHATRDAWNRVEHSAAGNRSGTR
jgi:hypothetical protein